MARWMLNGRPTCTPRAGRLRQIGAKLRVHWSTVSEQLQGAGIATRSSGPPGHPVSTKQILELRDRGLPWNEVAEQVDMTVSSGSIHPVCPWAS